MIKNRVESKKVSIYLRKYNEILFTRGEQAPNCKDLDLPELEIGCDKLFYQMIIRSDGNLRKKMIQYGRQGIGGICRNCDVIN